MAVSGSTRLQATTVLMLAAGSALFRHCTEIEPSAEILDLKMRLKVGDFLGLVPLIEKESAYYSENIKVMHAASDYAITVLTDLTERSPTFSLDGLKNYLTNPSAPSSWTYLWVPGARDAEASWRQVLQREPRCLHWETFVEKYGYKAAMGFDFSDKGSEQRKRDVAQPSVPLFHIDRDQHEIRIVHDAIAHHIPRPKSLLVEHLLLKVALNISSNLVMCRMDRVLGNIMLWVHASNNKLIDRAARYVQYLLKDAGMVNRFTYEDVVKEIFRLRAEQQKSESIVLKTFNSLKAKT